MLICWTFCCSSAGECTTCVLRGWREALLPTEQLINLAQPQSVKIYFYSQLLFKCSILFFCHCFRCLCPWLYIRTIIEQDIIVLNKWSVLAMSGIGKIHYLNIYIILLFTFCFSPIL